MKPVDVVYLYENIARELDVACAVTAILRQRYGLSVEIVQWPQSVPRLYGRVKPGVVVLPFCYFEHSFDCLLEWRDAVFFNLTWEQLFYPGNVRAKTPRGEFALKHVVHHSWSDVYADFARQLGIDEKYLLVNGQPAYALYDEPYRRYFIQRHELAARHGLDPAKRWVFFPENYNWAFYSQERLKFFIELGQSRQDVMEMRDFCARSFREVMQWFADLARTGEVEIIVRPRPSTPLEEFRAAVERVLPEIPSSLHVIQDETVREWILASDVVLSSHSTSLIEAAIARRSAYMVAPFAVPQALRQEWHRLAPRIETKGELFDACLRPVADSQSMPLQQWARSTFVSRGDVIENLAAHIAALAMGKSPRPPVPSRLCATAQGDIRWLPKWIWFVFRRVRSWYRRFVPPQIDPEVVKEAVSAGEIERRVQRWQKVLRLQAEGAGRLSA